MKKLISECMVLVMAVSLFACADAEQAKTVNVEDIKKNDGIMLEIISTPRMPNGDEEITKSVLDITYSGEVYDPDSEDDYSIQLDDEDLLYIYEFCIDAYENDTFDGYFEDACDGITYEFVFYDEDGKEHVIFEDGYCYNNKKINKIFNKLDKYAE